MARLVWRPSSSFTHLFALMLLGCDASTQVALLSNGPGDEADARAEARPLGDSPPITPQRPPSMEFPDPREERPDAALPVAPEPPEIASPLLHRYDFSGTGTRVADRVGGEEFDAHVFGGATLDGSGKLTLDGVDDFVELPHFIATLFPDPVMGYQPIGSVTFVLWFTWLHVRPWEHVFDFGQTWEANGEPGISFSHLFFTPMYVPLNPSQGSGTQLNFYPGGPAVPYTVSGFAPFPTGQEKQIAVVFEQSRGRDGWSATLGAFVDAESEGHVRMPYGVGSLQDYNCWLGQSQQSQDPHTHGSYNELRIYGGALTDVEIKALFEAGPDLL